YLQSRTEITSVIDMERSSLHKLFEDRSDTPWDEQDDLVKLAGVAKGTIVDLELHRRKPYPSTRRKLARALKVRPEGIAFLSPR
ncbi:MAG: helix-turn-helix transcriptional regulator, partial [Armatimonadetes bacterium]|nr:helix-turn-helix transcriptional regulator [Armatimonadota bacterium]